MKEFNCPKCQSDMIEGSILSSGIPLWIPGKPERTFWSKYGYKWNKKIQRSVYFFYVNL